MKLFLSFYCVLFFACGKSTSATPFSASLLSGTSFDVNQMSSNISPLIFHFVEKVDKVLSREISMDFATVHVAVNSNAYTKSSGTLVLPPNTNTASIDIIAERDTSIDNTGYKSPSSYPGYSLTWSDEFNGRVLDTSSWNYETGANGWGNNELENYTSSSKNSFIAKGGYLVIEARKEAQNSYTSARLQTKGKREFTYGRMDIRARLPKGKGLWPAIWMLGGNITTTPWPACGEIDIMELLGHEPNKVYGTMHWGIAGHGSTHIGGNYVLPQQDFSDKFHVFSVVWDSTKIEWYVDNQKYFTGNKSQVSGAYPFNKPFFFILNVAVGGSWPGNPDSTTVFPQRMVVDYVRVFQKK